MESNRRVKVPKLKKEGESMKKKKAKISQSISPSRGSGLYDSRKKVEIIGGGE